MQLWLTRSCGDFGSGRADLSAQEKALEFMLFDVPSFVQSGQAAPGPPVK